MTFSLQPFAPSIQGAFRVVLLDDAGFGMIDTSDRGFRRSWIALLLALPFIALHSLAVSHVMVDQMSMPPIPTGLAFFTGIVQWLISAGSLAMIAWVTGRQEKLRALIATDNWIGLWFMVLSGPIDLLMALDIIRPVSESLSFLLSLYSFTVGARMLVIILKLRLITVLGLMGILLSIMISVAFLVQHASH